jgi:hypothetical protein
MRNEYKVIVRKLEWKRQLRRTKSIWENYLTRKRDRCERVDWIYEAQDRAQWWTLLSMVIKFQFP